MLRDYRQGLEVAFLCDGTRVLTDILRDSPVGLVDTFRLLRALELMSCIQFTAERAPGPQRSVRASTPPRRVTGAWGDDASDGPPVRSASPVSAAPVRRVSSAAPAPARANTMPPLVPPPPEPQASRTSNAPTSQRPVAASGYRSGARSSDGGTARPVTQSGSYRALPRRETPTSTGGEARPAPASVAPRTAPARTTTGPIDRPTLSGLRAPVRQPSREEPGAEADSAAAVIARITDAETLYEVVGRDPASQARAIADVGRDLLRRLHPDRITAEDPLLLEDARAAARRVAEAVETLGDRRRRMAYDALTLPTPLPGRGVDLLGAEQNFKKGLICQQNQLGEKARDFFALAVEQDPHQAFYRVHLPAASFALTPPEDRRTRSKLLDEAREVVEAAGKDEAFCMVADMAVATGSTDVATRLFNRALQINSGSARARDGLIAIERGGEPQPETRNTGLFGKIFTRR
ncbi:MAG: hypothetical protein R3F60_17385 [bacterium]